MGVYLLACWSQGGDANVSLVGAPALYCIAQFVFFRKFFPFVALAHAIITISSVRIIRVPETVSEQCCQLWYMASK